MDGGMDIPIYKATLLFWMGVSEEVSRLDACRGVQQDV